MTLTIKQLRTILGKGTDKPEPKPREYIDVRTSNTTFATFFSIETGSECNRSCSFCPVSHSPREHDEWMPQSMFDHILDQLAEMRYTQRIALYSYNEPVRDPRLPALIAQVRARLPRTCIMINTNGDFFKSAADIQRLYDAGLNQMQINIYSAADGSGNADRIAKGIEKARKRQEWMQGLVNELPHLDQEASLYQHIGASKQACQVVPKFDFQPEGAAGHATNLPQQKHGISVRHHIANRAGNIPNFMPALDEPMSKMCIRPFRAMTVNWQGDVILCCQDYNCEASPGNVMSRSLVDLWNDPRFHAYRVKLKAKDRSIFLCDKCDYAGGFYTHMTTGVTFGDEEDARIVAADMRSSDAAGFGPKKLIQLKVKKPMDLPE